MTFDETNAVYDRLTDIHLEAIQKVINLADDFKIDRDELFKLFVAILRDVEAFRTFLKD